jgi:hypothetical protein
MAKLIYSAITSLDGYIADEDGKFDWAEPDEEVHTFEVLVAWETLSLADQPPVIQDFAAIWRAADKIVYSKCWKRSPAPGRGSSETSILKPSGS